MVQALSASYAGPFAPPAAGAHHELQHKPGGAQVVCQQQVGRAEVAGAAGEHLRQDLCRAGSSLNLSGLEARVWGEREGGVAGLVGEGYYWLVVFVWLNAVLFRFFFWLFVSKNY